jgi:hypothetical protein
VRKQRVRDESAQQGQRHGGVRPRLLFPHQEGYGKEVVQQQQDKKCEDHMRKNKNFHAISADSLKKSARSLNRSENGKRFAF